MNYKTYEVHVYDNGVKEWLLNDKLHREDGPAIVCTNGTKFWYLNGKLHRENGPAVIHANGDKCWYLNGKLVTEAEHERQTQAKQDDCSGKVVEIDGKKYKLQAI